MLAKAVFNELSIYGLVVVMGINSEPKGFEFDPPSVRTWVVKISNREVKPVSFVLS